MTGNPINHPAKIILASASPRRRQLLTEAGIRYTSLVKNIDETYPPSLKREQVALYLARKKAEAYSTEISEGYLVITADTIVCIDDMILGKPVSADDARYMLQMLSCRTHQVITAVCIGTGNGLHCFHVVTNVTFRQLTQNEINYYIETCKPFDKAGAYGIQEWIGHIGIESIHGSYDNVVGLPVAELCMQLQKIT